MFSGEFPPETDLPHSTMYQTQTDRLLSSDHQSGRMYHLHDHQYELANYCSSGCESSSSPSSYSAVLADETNKPMSGGLTQRNISSHSLMNDNNYLQPAAAPNVLLMMMLGGTHRLVDLVDSSCVRRVFSTGDLQFQIHQLSQQQHRMPKESNSSSIIEGMLSKACRYSPEEKKERIERYKTKRSHRNFNKKIKYVCRKTLADSRPRIRGRFARNNNNNNSNIEDESLEDKWAEEADDQWENNIEDDDEYWLNASWLLK